MLECVAKIVCLRVWHLYSYRFLIAGLYWSIAVYVVPTSGVQVLFVLSFSFDDKGQSGNYDSDNNEDY